MKYRVVIALEVNWLSHCDVSIVSNAEFNRMTC